MQTIQPTNQKETIIFNKLKQLSSEIGKNKLQRSGGTFISMTEIRKKERAFAKLNRQYRKLKIGF